MNSKKYALFAGQAYYPPGGMWDFKGLFTTKEEALKKGSELLIDSDAFYALDWFHVVDCNNMTVVYAEGSSLYGDPLKFEINKKS